MKSLITTLILFTITSFSIFSQEEAEPRKGTIGFSLVPTGNNEMIRFEDIVGAGSTDGNGFFTAGIIYLYPITRKYLELETGVEFSHHKITQNPAYFQGSNLTSREDQFSLITIPIGLRLSVLRHFYLHGGVFLNFNATREFPTDSQAGLGLQFGFGVKYDFASGTTIFAGTYFKAHSMLAIPREQYHQHLLDAGLRLGVGIPLKNMWK
jgi:hypothetical protein